MSEHRVLDVSKSDFKDLEAYLVKHDLLDEKRIWIAGFDNYRKATDHAVAENLFYGNKKLIVLCVKDKNIYRLKNTKNGFKISVIGLIGEKHKVSSLRILLHPTIDITCVDGSFYSLKVTKNKSMVKVLKNTIKNK